MATLRRSVSSVSALTAFEAAARLSSFTQAANELGVTQAAVSRQIKQMEEELNTALFIRAHRRVELTTHGAALSSVLTNSFQRIAEMLDTIRQPVETDSVSVGATLAFTHYWLLPRLSQFRTAYPDIRLKLVAEDSATDLRRERLDLSIVYGKPPFLSARSVAHLKDEVFPVCSPALLDRLAMTPETADLLHMPLVSSDWVDPSWLSWRAWARTIGMDPFVTRTSGTSRLRFNHYTDTIQAAMNGEGVALGWGTLISDMLRDGRLVRITGHSVAVAECHHLLEPAGREPTPAAALFRDWLEQVFRDES